MPQGILLKEIADYLGADLFGDGEARITGINSLQQATEDEITFLANPRYKKQLDSTAASAVIMRPVDRDTYQGALLAVDDPYLSYARLTKLFDNQPVAAAGVHPSAVVAESAVIHASAVVGPNATIGEHVEIGEQAVVGANVYIGDGATIGADCQLAANVTLYHGVLLGDRVRIHSGSVIGADGFGFARDRDGWVKIYQLGSVEIGSDVEIGACTTIDRGALGNTVIGDGVILDNHVQIAHNVKVGKNTAMASYAGVSGSAEIGEKLYLCGAGWCGRAYQYLCWSACFCQDYNQ